MPIGPTYATFGNTQFSRGFDFTFAPGVQPSVCMLYTLPHTTNLPQVAQLQLRTTGDITLTFRDCLLEEPKLTAGRSGQYLTLPIKDRRWKWQWGSVYGHFNKPKPDGSYEREKTPQQLASILLDIMGELNYDVSRLPNVTRPERRWDGDTASTELDRLCAELSCVVVLNPITDRAELWPIGQGGTLPTGATIGKAYSPVLPAVPKRIKVEAAETLFQATFFCIAVGLDIDGQWKPIDQLSYKPSHGWNGWDAHEGFPSIPDSLTYVHEGRTLKVRDLAAATVFRCYRCVGVQGFVNNVVPPLLENTFQQPQSMRDLRLFDYLLDEELSTVDGGLRPLPAVVYARWVREDKPLLTSITKYPYGFGLDSEHNILHFGEPLFLPGNIPAEVQFECSFHAGASGIFHRRSIEQPTTSQTVTPTHTIQRPELRGRVIYRSSSGGGIISIEDNLVDTDLKLYQFHDAELAGYALQQGGTLSYPKLLEISPDGLTQQVSWSGGGQRPATTTASQAQRHSRLLPSIDEQRERLANKRADQRLQRVEFAFRAQNIA